MPKYMHPYKQIMTFKIISLHAHSTTYTIGPHFILDIIGCFLSHPIFSNKPYEIYQAYNQAQWLYNTRVKLKMLNSLYVFLHINYPVAETLKVLCSVLTGMKTKRCGLYIFRMWI